MVVLVLLIALGLVLTSKFVKTDKAKKHTLVISSVGVFVCHYSSLLYHWIGHAVSPDTVSTALSFLHSNPNLALPIYPCNIMMITCIIYAFVYDKNEKLGKILCDFIICFGIVSGLGGMFANADYFNPNVVKNFDIYKSAAAHAIMIYNILLLFVFKHFKLETPKNVLRTAIGCLMMAVVALLDSFIVLAIRDEATVLNYNPMFLYHSPFDANDKFLTFWIIIPLFLVVLFGVLTLIETIKLPTKDRWYSKLKK